MNRSFFIKSMGCKSNQFEGSLIIENLVENGFVQVFDLKKADYYILNSCSVTQKSDNEALYLLRNAVNLNHDMKTVLTGCVAQLEKEELLKTGYIHYIFGNDDKFKLGEFLNTDIKNRVSDIMNIDKFNYKVLKDTSKTRYSLKIQDGCNNRCAYCIIPFARGKSRSAESDFVIEQINNAEKNGFKEVVLTGIHIGQWGADIGKTFVDIIKDIEGKTTIPRYRLGSLNPLEITEELLEILKKSQKFCPHFHLSLQSACDNTLKRMNRFYTTEKYLAQIDEINRIFNKPFIGCDIIAGFVGETEEDFQITVENLKKSGLSKIHTFPYSIRKGTQAETMDGHLSDDEKQRRADIIKDISRVKFEEFGKSNINTERTVLIEKRPDKKTGHLKGVSDNYLNVIIDENPDNMPDCFNTLRRVHLDSCSGEIFHGHFV